MRLRGRFWSSYWTLRAYRQIDRKIKKIYDNPPISDDGMGTVTFRASMRGLPGPRQRQGVVLERWNSLTFTSDGPWLADRLLDMTGSFSAEPLEGGQSQVTHEYTFRFKGPLTKVLEWYSRSWLQRDVKVELERLREYFSKCREEGEGHRTYEDGPCMNR